MRNQVLFVMLKTEREVYIMNAQDIVTLIQCVGFPIVMCGAMAYYVKYITDKHRETTSEMNERHSAEMDKVTQAINNNTLAVQHLSDMIEKK